MSTPAIAAESALASVLITSIFTPRLARSARRSGTSVQMPPSWMPMLKMLANDHIAIVASDTALGGSVSFIRPMSE